MLIAQLRFVLSNFLREKIENFVLSDIFKSFVNVIKYRINKQTELVFIGNLFFIPAFVTPNTSMMDKCKKSYDVIFHRTCHSENLK